MIRYAYIRSGQVVEHSITAEMVKARGVNISVLVRYDEPEKPPVNDWQYLEIDVATDGKNIEFRWIVRNFDFDQVAELFNNIVAVKNQGEDVDRAELNRLILRLQLVFRTKLVEYLDMYANAEGYATADNLLSYVGSGVSHFADAAKKLMGIRDTIYLGFDRLCADIYKGKHPPVSTFEQAYRCILEKI